jgi:hypothetical protein
VVALQHILDAPIEPFYHAIGLGSHWRGQAVLDTQIGAETVKFMCASGRALAQAKQTVGELLAVVRENVADPYRARALKVAQKPPRIGRCFPAVDTDEHPPCRLISVMLCITCLAGGSIATNR